MSIVQCLRPTTLTRRVSIPIAFHFWYAWSLYKSFLPHTPYKNHKKVIRYILSLIFSSTPTLEIIFFCFSFWPSWSLSHVSYTSATSSWFLPCTLQPHVSTFDISVGTTSFPYHTLFRFKTHPWPYTLFNQSPKVFSPASATVSPSSSGLSASLKALQ